MEKRLIVGLGNPGLKYSGTRHNAGFEILKKFAERNGFPEFQEYPDFLISEKVLYGMQVFLVFPLTYMNNSGLAVLSVLKKKIISLEDLMVIHDDLDLPFGKFRLKKNSSHGGHNGIKSIESFLESKDYFRLKLGIDSPECSEVIDFVLGKWSEDEYDSLHGIIDKGVDLVESWLKGLIGQEFKRE